MYQGGGSDLQSQRGGFDSRGIHSLPQGKPLRVILWVEPNSGRVMNGSEQPCALGLLVVDNVGFVLVVVSQRKGLWAFNSVGRVSALQAESQEFESPKVHARKSERHA